MRVWNASKDDAASSQGSNKKLEDWQSVFVCVFLVTVWSIVSGCASTPGHARGLQESGTAAVNDTEKGANKKSPISEEPYEYVWQKQLLQEIVVPGAIRGGVFYPAHKETVIVRPSEPVLRSLGKQGD